MNERHKNIFIISILLIGILLCQGLFVNSASASEVDTAKAVIHHTASGDVSAATIDEWHKARGWDGIGYHFIIRASGKVEKGRSITKKGAHAKGRNHWVGIALTGYDTFTMAQIDALKKLLSRLRITKIERHHENCPGPGIDMDSLL